MIASANGTSENGVRTEVIVPQICVLRTWYPGLARDLLCCLVSPRAHVNQVDPKLFQLAGQQNALGHAPTAATSRLSPSPDFRPIRGAEPHKKRVLTPQSTDGLDHAENEACAILERQPTVSI